MAIWSKDEKHAEPEVTTDGFKPDDIQEGEVNDNADGLQRHLANRQIQLIAIGGSIGTALFVSIGTALERGGPGSLFLAYTIYACIIGLVNNGTAEMTVAFPVSGGFPRLAGHWVDDAFGFMAAWNFFLYEALLIPFEITAFIAVASFWSADLTNAGPSGGIICGIIILYALINILAVRAYGEAEFWLSGGKVILIFMLFCFTFITMVGGNPQGDAYGFRYWENGHAFKEYISVGSKGRFEGFLACLWSASFCIVGPEYMSMVAAEARRPRVYIKTAFKTVYFRFALFFIGGALAAGIVCASYWPALVNLIEGDKTANGAGASPYVIAMQHMNISVLPHFVNAFMLTSIFSAGNTYTYCAVRNLYGLALEGRAPRFLAYTTKKGVPLYCFCVVMVFPFLSFLSLGGGGAQKALQWLINITTAGGLVNFIVMCVTYIRFYAACKVQGLDRKSLPYTGYCQPYCAWIALVFETAVILCYGYSTFRYPPDHWDTVTFFTYYILVILDPILFIFWKLFKRTKWLKAHEIDLVWERPTIDAYEATFIDKPIGFWRELVQLFGVWKQSGGNDKRIGSISN